MLKFKEVLKRLEQMNIKYYWHDNRQKIDVPICYLHPDNYYSPDNNKPKEIKYTPETSFLKNDHRICPRMCENCCNCGDW